MKFTFDKDAMIREIAIAQEIISTKQVAEIRSNVALYAYNNSLTIKATDSKVNFETTLPVQIQEEGETTIYCDKFMGILTSLPEGEIEFNQPVENGNDQAITVIITCWKSIRKIRLINSRISVPQTMFLILTFHPRTSRR